MWISGRHKLRNGVYSLITQVLGDEQGLVSLTTMRGPARGLHFRLDLVRRIESGYWLGKYDLNILQALSSILQPGWVVWDCGVYIGYYSAFFAKYVGSSGRVVGFEPDPRNLERTRVNMKLNKFDNVTFIHAAIGAPVGDTEFWLSDSTNSHLPGMYVGASVEDYKTHETVDRMITIKCLSLDQIFEDENIPHPDLIKLDIEGAEKEALVHLHHLFELQRPILVLELHNPECDKAAWEFSQRERYSLQSLNTGLMVDNPQNVGGTLLCRPL